MSYDLIIRNGTVVDGSGGARYRGDVGISCDRIASIGRIDERGRREIDAEGHVVTPGFIDGHTHMDAQLFWDPLGKSSCWHGVTSVVMGNCGFTLAPSLPGKHKLVVDNLQEAEEIPESALSQGIDWTWETFPEFLDAVARTSKAINYGVQIGHSAVRISVMEERAFGGTASDDDIANMQKVVRQALEAGAFGFSTSISDHHVTPDGQPIASRSTSWEELGALVGVLGEFGSRVFQLAVDTERAESNDRDLALEFYEQLRAFAVATRVPTTYGLRRQHLQDQLDAIDAVAESGGVLFGQCQSVSETVWSFATLMPFDNDAAWRPVRALPIDEQAAILSDPDRRAVLIAATEARKDSGAFYDKLVPMLEGSRKTLGEIAASQGTSSLEALVRCALETGMTTTFCRAEDPETGKRLTRGDAPPADGDDLRRRRCARAPNLWRRPTDDPAQPLGARTSGIQPGRGGANDHARPRARLACSRPRSTSRRNGCRHQCLRPSSCRTRPSDGRAGPSRGSESDRESCSRVPLDDRRR